jgi:hypothetical protein
MVGGQGWRQGTGGGGLNLDTSIDETRMPADEGGE